MLQEKLSFLSSAIWWRHSNAALPSSLFQRFCVDRAWRSIFNVSTDWELEIHFSVPGPSTALLRCYKQTEELYSRGELSAPITTLTLYASRRKETLYCWQVGQLVLRICDLLIAIPGYVPGNRDMQLHGLYQTIHKQLSQTTRLRKHPHQTPISLPGRNLVTFPSVLLDATSRKADPVAVRCITHRFKAQ